MAVQVTRAGVALTVGIIILAALITGGLLWVKNTGDQARREEATKIADQQLEEQRKNGIALNEGNSESTGDGADTKQEEKQAEQENGSSTTSGVESAGEQAGELPQTGPASDIVTLLAIGALTYGVVSHLRSRQQRFGRE